MYPFFLKKKKLLQKVWCAAQCTYSGTHYNFKKHKKTKLFFCIVDVKSFHISCVVSVLKNRLLIDLTLFLNDVLGCWANGRDDGKAAFKGWLIAIMNTSHPTKLIKRNSYPQKGFSLLGDK